MTKRSTMAAKLFAGTSALALALGGQLLLTGNAAAACSMTGDLTVTCEGADAQTTTVTSPDPGFTVIVQDEGGIVVDGAPAISLTGDKAVVRGDNDSPIISNTGYNGSSGATISVGYDADVQVGNVVSTGKGGPAIRAGDSLFLLLREGGTITSDTAAVIAGRDAEMQIDGTITTTGAEGGNKPSAGIIAGPGAIINVSGTGAINSYGDGIMIAYTGDGSVAEQVADITVDGSILSSDGVGIRITDAMGGGPIPVENTGERPYAFITVNGRVEGQGGPAIQVDTNAPIDTTLRVSGTLIGNGQLFLIPGDPVAVSLNGGDDTVILENGFDITGSVRAGDEVNGDTLALGGTNAGTFDIGLADLDGTEGEAEQYLGFERFEKIESSIWTLVGENLDAGTFDVLGGTLYANSNTPDLAFNVAGGATLGGTGTIGSFLVGAGGHLAPGNSIGTLTVAGNGQFEAGSIYDVELNGATSDLVQAGGTVTINGGTVNVIAQPFDLVLGKRYTIVDSTAPIEGPGFAGVTDTLPDLDFAVSYDVPTEVQLGFTQGTAGNGGLSQKGNALAAEFGAADASLLFVESLVKRLDGSASAGMGQTAAITPLGYDRVKRPDTVAGMDAVHNADMVAPVAEYGGLAVFLGVMGEDRSIDADGFAAGHDAQTGGVFGGLEYTTYGSGVTTFGIAGAYSRTNVDVTDGGADIDSGHIGLFASHMQGPLSVAGAISYQWSDYDFDRTIFLAPGGAFTASGNADGDAFSGFGEVFYDLAPQIGLSGTSLGPVARLRGVSTDRDAFAENGAGIFGLSVDDSSTSHVFGDIGLRASTMMMLGSVALTPQVELRYERMFSDGTDSSVSSIPLAGASFVTPVSYGARDRVGVGLSVGMAFSDTFSASARYDGSFGDGSESHRGSAALSLKF